MHLPILGSRHLQLLSPQVIAILMTRRRTLTSDLPVKDSSDGCRILERILDAYPVERPIKAHPREAL
jgi:hypothetical protein